jgi:hypothetical protein
MRQDDYFLRQIDILGRILGKILTELLKKKSSGEIMDSVEVTAQALKSELDIDLKSLILVGNENLVEFLKTEKKFGDQHLEKMAELFFIVGQDLKNEKALLYLEKSVTIYEYLNKTSSTYSLDRIYKIDKIKKMIS